MQAATETLGTTRPVHQRKADFEQEAIRLTNLRNDDKGQLLETTKLKYQEMLAFGGEQMLQMIDEQ